ncbi:hypothetical protein [Moorella sp. E306M]|uniref:hypothetical protein n=1 Tax=Moorella sp. E306M TaxID=2572683 RepID=UPI0010FFAEF2|nr:hypothetical protein [Moorella sp. E306M]GEA17513.1 hypothetical protein E306M_06470 [Moorella sp. E306M]
MVLWVCGKNVAELEEGIVWELQGIFTTKEAAVAACKNERYFIGPVELNKPLPEETTSWVGCEYPLG